MGYSQTTEVTVDSLPNVSVKLDSIECWTRHNNLIYYSITNNSNDTLIYTSNTCPAYNLFTLTLKDSTILINDGIDCYFNSVKAYKILPNETVSISEYISYFSSNNIEKEEYVKLSIPYVLKGTTLLRLSFYENDKLELTYEGTTKFVNHTVTENKVKKNKKNN